MSGDMGSEDQTIIFYHKKMTDAKMVLLRHKGIKLDYKDLKTESRNKY